MARVAIGIEYDGSAYSGWQLQQHAPSVQAALERALSRVADHELRLTAAGRTDAGVHALMQVAHFDTGATRPDQAWVLGGTAECPDDVSVLWARQVPDDFHARFSALSRSYVYRIVNRRVRPAIDRGRTWWLRRPLDAEAMHVAAQSLVGEHDFSAFRAAECQSPTPVRRVLGLAVQRDSDRVELRITANAFLHHMVRNVAGALVAVGVGDRPGDWVAELLASRDRTRGGVTAPPQGLYFAGVAYDARWGLPAEAAGLR
jgi:tRNA pseudouridine38-40 synthase